MVKKLKRNERKHVKIFLETPIYRIKNWICALVTNRNDPSLALYNLLRVGFLWLPYFR